MSLAFETARGRHEHSTYGTTNPVRRGGATAVSGGRNGPS